eukprot:CAMPEP_0197731554 /NCGR_PEP_ID=MMETSP1434-20131217/37893_1 /TAXON_ID=265543 /ORGANISM="Minutocellus polymorphus, Strain CCMP3303" /LENGTH=63 /DNA_ID=CAMNT_0043318565 /DNA_START=58 /DNA_END=246 /DNA_ORIENTATION=-
MLVVVAGDAASADTGKAETSPVSATEAEERSKSRRPSSSAAAARGGGAFRSERGLCGQASSAW